MPARLPWYFCPLLSGGAAQTRKEFAGQGEFLFEQSLWGVFTHGDLVQTRRWHWLGGDLEGELSFAGLDGCATKSCQIPVP